MIFKNIKQADEYQENIRMSYRMGSIYDDKGIIRIYSNIEKVIMKHLSFFYYKLKNDKNR